jgi:CRP-like cAMP-binding protein
MANDETIGALVRASTTVRRAAGPLISESDTRVALMLRGTVVASWCAADGRNVFIGLYGSGQVMGLATPSGGSMTARIDALTEVAVVTWRSEVFRRIAASDPSMIADLLDRSIYSIRALNHLLLLRSFTSARSRLAGLLLRYAPFCFATESPLVPRRQLGALAGVTPRMVSTILRDWEAAGIVHRAGTDGLVLDDPAGLAAEAAPLDEFPRPDRTSPGAWLDPALGD